MKSNNCWKIVGLHKLLQKRTRLLSILVVLFSFCSLVSYAQGKDSSLIYNVTQSNEDFENTIEPSEIEDTIFSLDPSYPGGIEACRAFVKENLCYPAKAKRKKISGIVYVSFVVNKNGSLSNFVILRSPDARLDNEALRLVKSMPNWIPAKIDGKDVASYFTMPIKFVLREDDKKGLKKKNDPKP